MKKINKCNIFISALFILSSNLLYSSSNLALGNDTGEYDKIFEKIGETRVGIDTKEINKIKNPFIVIYKNSAENNKTKKAKIVYRLNAIFDTRAMINGKWYKKHSKIGIYKLVRVKQNSVLLRSENTSKELFIRKDNGSKIKFSSK